MKYPRTYHLPYSPGTTSDDRISPEEDVQNIIGKKVISALTRISATADHT